MFVEFEDLRSFVSFCGISTREATKYVFNRFYQRKSTRKQFCSLVVIGELLETTPRIIPSVSNRTDTILIGRTITFKHCRSKTLHGTDRSGVKIFNYDGLQASSCSITRYTLDVRQMLSRTTIRKMSNLPQQGSVYTFASVIPTLKTRRIHKTSSGNCSSAFPVFCSRMSSQSNLSMS